LPLHLFGSVWARWITDAAEAASCPVDYVAMPLLAMASVLIGNARWAAATSGWIEPPHLWLAVVGDSGTGKSPGADCLLREVLPELERRMLNDFPDRLQEWMAETELKKGAFLRWRRQLREAPDDNHSFPSDPPALPDLQPPQAPRLRQNDVTIEKVAELLAAAAPKGLLIVRDELAGWVASMNTYHGGGRQFWLEAYGGRAYRVERKTRLNPIVLPRLAVGVYGGVQPDKLPSLLRCDDGLTARFLWAWPTPVPFRLSHQAPGIDWAIGALDRLRELDLRPTIPPAPLMLPLAPAARPLIEELGQLLQEEQERASGTLRAAYGKARGQTVRLALVIELLRWCGQENNDPPPLRVGASALEAAGRLMMEYFLPMAAQVDHEATNRLNGAARPLRRRPRPDRSGFLSSSIPHPHLWSGN
jgi:hypothetical protein